MISETAIATPPAVEAYAPPERRVRDDPVYQGELSRAEVRGKFLFAGDEKLYIRGVTYGTFRPADNGEEYEQARVERDFTMMAGNGINAVRVYTPPPRWLLDVALRCDLRVMVGLPWEQHIAFLEGRKVARSIEERVRQGVRACAGHPALLCFAVGNEIPASIVRWHGARRVEAFLRRLTQVVKEEDPGALVTYVNFPSTEYLDLGFVDFVSFNVYLEERGRLEQYLARLQNLAGEKPLLMAEIGLDSRRNGKDAQAHALDWQVRAVFEAGCAGAIVFAWTDEWRRGGHDVDDWDFGLVDRERRAKPALAAVRTAYQSVPFSKSTAWPRTSVVVCSYNGARTIADCLDGLQKVNFPDFEVIVVDDGSTDATAQVASTYDVHLVRSGNQGLGAARNEGMRAATGEIVAYIDDDARPDPDWLSYLAGMFKRTDVVAVGGLNIAPEGNGLIAEAVSHAPGGPVHVLITDTVADHLPGCNLTIRKSALEAIGGFDPRYRAAGDDVDVCWRLRDAGGILAFHPGAMVWHNRRNSVKTYWKQQLGYGRAEALLEDKWPERYNAIGHLTWSGRLYGKGLQQALTARRGRIYQGRWGSALFQSMHDPVPGLLASLPLLPEWWIVVAAFGFLAILGLAWPPLLILWPIFGLTLLGPLAQAVLGAFRADIPAQGRSPFQMMRLRGLTAFLHLIQPVARLLGRIRFGLTPWRLPGSRAYAVPTTRVKSVWSEQWHAPEVWLQRLATQLRSSQVVVTYGGDFDCWDLDIRGGLLGSARVLLAIEDHGAGTQLCRFRIAPNISIVGTVVFVGLGLLIVVALADRAWFATGVLGLFALTIVVRACLECAASACSATRAIEDLPDDIGNHG